MDDSRNRISNLYHQALARPSHERAAFVAEACSGDERLRHEIESLLAFEADAESAAWRSDGKELFFLAADGTMMAAGFNPETGPVDAEPQKLFATPLRFGNNHPYAVAPDGQRFLMPLPLDEPPRLILDWHTLLPR